MIAVWGAGGFIGSRLLSENRLAVMHGDTLSRPGIRLPEKITGVIWTAGWPGQKNIDDVEATPERSKLQNVWEPLELAARCYDQGVRMLVMSSGCLFDGTRPDGNPWTEDDAPNFTHPVYHRDKWELEQGLRKFGSLITIFRFRLPFDSSHHPRNMLHKFAGWESVMDVNQSFTWIPDLVRAVKMWERDIIEDGIWHVTQPGTLNNYEAVKIYLNPSITKIKGSLGDFTGSPCPRSHAILDCSKLLSICELTPAEKAWKMTCLKYIS